MSTTIPRRWYVVADGARAHILTKAADKFVAPLGEQLIGVKLKSREMLADKPGRAFDSRGGGRHAMELPTDPHRKAKADFARELAQILERELSKHHYDELVMVAAPQTLGDIRGALSDTVRKRVVQEVDKDFTHVPDHELGKWLMKLENRSPQAHDAPPGRLTAAARKKKS